MSLSGGPTFSVANLSTKEFYQGILSPIETSLLSYYLEGGYNRNILLNLLISDIVVSGPKSQRVSGTVKEFPNFYSFLNGLLDLGLTVKSANKPVAEGPALTEEEARDPKLLASLASGTAAGNTTLDLKRYDVPLELAKTADPNLSESEFKRFKELKKSIYFRLVKAKKEYDYCFDRAKLYAEHFPFTHRVYLTDPKTKKLVIFNLDVYEQDLCGSTISTKRKANDSKNWKLSDLTFETRSVVGIINFLGEIVRSGQPLKVGKDPQSVPSITLFEARQQDSGGPSMSATVDGQTYYVKVGTAGDDYSSRVIELLAELTSLHSSAKDLPAPNVITVISP